jgi:hypothetical protein
MKERHYSVDKKGRTLEVRANFRHKCNNKCSLVKEIRDIISKCFAIIDLLQIEPKYRQEYIKKFKIKVK